MLAVLSSLKAQNNALHVTTEKLVNTNSELMERLNRQSGQVKALQDALGKAQAAKAPQEEEPTQQKSGWMAGQNFTTLIVCLPMSTSCEYNLGLLSTTVGHLTWLVSSVVAHQLLLRLSTLTQHVVCVHQQVCKSQRPSWSSWRWQSMYRSWKASWQSSRLLLQASRELRSATQVLQPVLSLT